MGSRRLARGVVVFGSVLAAGLCGGGSAVADGAVESGWLAQGLSGERVPTEVRNNLIAGAIADRDRAVAEWRAAVRLGRKPSALSKPEYAVVWMGHANASDENTRGLLADAGGLAENTVSGPADAQSRFVPGADGFAVVDSRRENVDGSPNSNYGKVVNLVQLPAPWGVETEAHHMQYQWEDGQPLLAGGLFNDTTFVLSLKDVPNLQLMNTITPQDTPNGSVPDAYDALGGGRFTGTYMGGPEFNYAGSPGEVVVFKPDPEKGLVVASETPAGQPDARDQGNPGGLPEPCNEEEAAPIGTCANPHGVQARPDINRMLTSDYGEPKLVVLDPAKSPGGTGFRPTVRIWDTSDVDHPKLVSVAHMADGWRPPSSSNNSMQLNRGIMEAAKTWPADDSFKDTIPSNAAFAGAMCGGGVFFTSDLTKLKGDSTHQWHQVWDDGIALVAARHGDIDDWAADSGGCEGGAWMQVSRNNRWLMRAVGGDAPNQDNLYSKGQPNKILYNIDVQALVRNARNGHVQCDLARGIDTDNDGKIDIAPADAVKRLANGEQVADCPHLLSTLPVDDNTTGGPHWGAIDNHSLTADGFPTRLLFSDYFVARSGVDGNHRLYLADIDPKTGELSYDTAWRDENTGQRGVNFNRPDWPNNPGIGYYKPHSMIWACPPGICPADKPDPTLPQAQPNQPTTPGNAGPPTPADTATTTTWNGTCKFTGTSYFVRPYRLTPELNGDKPEGSGTCKGTLDGKPYDGPVGMFIDGRMEQAMSCEAGVPIDVSGWISFGDQPDSIFEKRIGVTWQIAPRLLTESVIHFTGAYKGNGVGHLSWMKASGPDTLVKCSGEGVLTLDFELSMDTLDSLYG